MSLFGTLIKQGAKAADSLFDDVAVQAKKHGGQSKPLPGWDEAAWIEKNPPPDVRSDTPEYKSWSNRRSAARLNSQKPHYNSIGEPIQNGKFPHFDEAAWEELNPKPKDKSKYSTWYSSKVRARERAALDGYDNIGGKLPTESPYPNFNEEEWTRLHPKPDAHWESPEIKRWYDLRNDHRRRSNLEGYDELGQMLPKPPPQLVDERGGVIPVRSRKLAKDRTPEESASHNEWARQRYLSDPERFKQYGRNAYYANPGKAIQAALERSRGIKQATRKDADPARMDEIYRIAAEVRDITGDQWEVDHVIPLRGRLPNSRERSVSGLHHQDNLMIVPMRENRSKSASFVPGAPPTAKGIRNARALLKRIKKEHGLLDMPE